jgi:hypothetical protein
VQQRIGGVPRKSALKNGLVLQGMYPREIVGMGRRKLPQLSDV